MMEKWSLTAITASLLTASPRKMAVIGAGAIGLELGCVWSRLGAEVEIIEFLTGDLSAAGSQKCPRWPVGFLKSRDYPSAWKLKSLPLRLPRAKRPSLLNPPREKKNSRSIVCSSPWVVGPVRMGLVWQKQEFLVDERGRISVDESFQTNLTGIRAIGDVIHGPMLAHKAEEDGVACAEILAGQSGHVNYDMVPGVIYVDPEVANVGLSEKQAKERGIEVRSGSFPMAANGRALATGATDGMVKWWQMLRRISFWECR